MSVTSLLSVPFPAPNCPAPTGVCRYILGDGKNTFVNALNSLFHFYGVFFLVGVGQEIGDLSQEKHLLFLQNYN